MNNGYHLALSTSEIVEWTLEWRKVETKSEEFLSGTFPQFLPVPPAYPPQERAAGGQRLPREYITESTHVLCLVDILVNDSNPTASGPVQRRQLHTPPLDIKMSAVRFENTRDETNQRRFSGISVPYYADDFARKHVQVYGTQSLDAAITF